MKIILLFALLAVVANAVGQDWPVKKMVTDKKTAGLVFESIPAFTFSANREVAGRGTYQQLQLEVAFTRQLLAQRPQAIQIAIPLSTTETLTCELVKASLGNIKFTENNDQVIPNVQIPVLYRGIVSGEQQKNNVVLTVNDEYVSMLITLADRSMRITQANSANPLTYRLYDSRRIQLPATAMQCKTDDLPVLQTQGGIALNGTYNRTTAIQDKCVNVFVDCSFLLYQFLDSSRQRTTNYVHELFNLVTTGYLNDSINILVTGINIWTVTDPYRRTSSDRALRDIGAYYQDGFWGNIGVNLDYSTGLGGKGWIAKIKAVTTNSCPAYNAADSTGAFAYNDLNFSGNYDPAFPSGPNVTADQLALVMHEIGHKLGSVHTHRCGWQLTPTIVGAIDSCTSIENPPCATVGTTPPPGGGTIMSYCHLLAGSFITYANGFGMLPGRAIRNFINNSPCIPSCLACLIGKANGNKADDGFNISPQAHLLPGPAKRPSLRSFLPHDHQQVAFSPPAVSTVVATSTALVFRKPAQPVLPYATQVVTK